LPQLSQSCLFLPNTEVIVNVDKYGNFFAHSSPTNTISNDKVAQVCPTICSFSMQETPLKIKQGTFTFTERDIKREAIICATTLGSVYTFVQIDITTYQHFKELSQKIQELNSASISLSPDIFMYRSQSIPCNNVIDGEFVSTFLDMNEARQSEIMANKSVTLKQIMDLIEDANNRINT